MPSCRTGRSYRNEELLIVMTRNGYVLEATPPELDIAQGRALMEEVVSWCIDAYYGAA